MADLIDYRMELVGGPFDGTDGMRWRDDGEHAPPKRVLIGVCPGDGSCNSFAATDCETKGKRHPYFWLPDESSRPPRTTAYELQDSFAEPEEMTNMRIVPGRAIYVVGGFLLPSRGDMETELPEERERELVLAGGHQDQLEEG